MIWASRLVRKGGQVSVFGLRKKISYKPRDACRSGSTASAIEPQRKARRIWVVGSLVIVSRQNRLPCAIAMLLKNPLVERKSNKDASDCVWKIFCKKYRVVLSVAILVGTMIPSLAVELMMVRPVSAKTAYVLIS